MNTDTNYTMEQKQRIKACKTNTEVKDILNSLQNDGISLKMVTHGSEFPIAEINLYNNGKIRILFPYMWYRTFRKYTDFARNLILISNEQHRELTNIWVEGS